MSEAASRPARGGWIEIRDGGRPPPPREGSRPARGGWIEIGSGGALKAMSASRPARGGWIEIIKLVTAF